MTDLTPIEERLAHLARAVEDISDVVARQSDQIARLEARLSLLMEREAAREAETGTVPLADPPPPHW